MPAVPGGFDALSAAIDLAYRARHLTNASGANLTGGADRPGIAGLAVRRGSAVAAVRRGNDADARAIHLSGWARDTAGSVAANFSRVADGSSLPAPACAARAAVVSIDAWIHAGAAAIHQPGLTRQLTHSRIANLPGGARGAGVCGEAVVARAAVPAVGQRIDAGRSAVHEPGLAGQLASAIDADPARPAHGARIRSVTVAQSSAVIEVGIGIGARASAIDEAGLTRDLARSGVADLAGAAARSAVGARAVANGAAVRPVRLRIDACPVAIEKAGLATERARPAAAYLPGRTNHARIRVQAVARGAAVARIVGGVDANAPTIHEARLTAEATGAVVADLPSRTGHARVDPRAIAGSAAVISVAGGIDASSAAVQEP